MNRKDNELPLSTSAWGWKYHHTGIPTDRHMPGERYLPNLKCFVSGFSESPFGIEWMRFEDDSPVHPLVKRIPHLAFEVEDLDLELTTHKLKTISYPESPSDGVRAAMIEHNGVPVELIEFSENKKPDPGKPNDRLLNFHSPVLFVTNISRSVSFYTNLLGFKIIHDFGKNVILDQGLTLWEAGPDHIIPEALDISSPVNRFELYFDAPDIETCFHSLENAGVKFLHGLHEEPWGQRTIRFFDPDGHLLETGEPLEVFVRNLSARGLNTDQISQKTGIHPDTVKSILTDT